MKFRVSQPKPQKKGNEWVNFEDERTKSNTEHFHLCKRLPKIQYEQQSIDVLQLCLLALKKWKACGGACLSAV